MSTATLTNIAGYQAPDAGVATIEGDRSVLDQLKSTLVSFEVDFEILPGTDGADSDDELYPFEVGSLADPAE